MTNQGGCLTKWINSVSFPSFFLPIFGNTSCVSFDQGLVRFSDLFRMYYRLPPLPPVPLSFATPIMRVGGHPLVPACFRVDLSPPGFPPVPSLGPYRVFFFFLGASPRYQPVSCLSSPITFSIPLILSPSLPRATFLCGEAFPSFLHTPFPRS